MNKFSPLKLPHPKSHPGITSRLELHPVMAAAHVPLGILLEYGMSWSPDMAPVPEPSLELTSTPESSPMKTPSPESAPALESSPERAKVPPFGSGRATDPKSNPPLSPESPSLLKPALLLQSALQCPLLQNPSWPVGP